MKSLLEHRPDRRARRRAATVAAVTALVLPLSACTRDTGAVDTNNAVETTDQDRTEPEAGIDPATLSFEDLSDDLVSRIGEEVMVTARVEDVVTPGVFLINATTGNSLEPIAVVGVDPSVGVVADSEVVFTGMVRESLEPRQVERLLEVQLEDEMLTDYDGRPYIELMMIHDDV